MKLLRRTLLLSGAAAIVGCAIFGAVLWTSGWRAYVVHTGSMTPTISSGTLIIDRPAGPVHVGQVITFAKVPGEPTTHRVHAITPAGIETKGDANPTPDFGYVSPSQVKGIVAAVIPYGGFVVLFCSHPTGVVGLVLLMCSICLAWDLSLGKGDVDRQRPRSAEHHVAQQ